jgi:hypothetical protein
VFDFLAHALGRIRDAARLAEDRPTLAGYMRSAHACIRSSGSAVNLVGDAFAPIYSSSNPWLSN